MVLDSHWATPFTPPVIPHKLCLLQTSNQKCKKHFWNATASVDERVKYAIVHIHENSAQFAFAQIGGVSFFYQFSFSIVANTYVLRAADLLRIPIRLLVWKMANNNNNNHRWRIIIVAIATWIWLRRACVACTAPILSLSLFVSLRRKTLSIKHSFQKSIEYNFAFSGPSQLPNTVPNILRLTV